MDATHSPIPGLICGFGRGPGTAQISVSHCRDQTLHLIDDQDAVHQHPNAVRRSVLVGLMHGNAGFDPTDELISPHPVQLPKGWQAWKRDGLVGIRAFTKHL